MRRTGSASTKEETQMNRKVLGCLLGAAVGDAMGAATETKSVRQIEQTFGGKVREFKNLPRIRRPEEEGRDR